MTRGWARRLAAVLAVGTLTGGVGAWGCATTQRLETGRDQVEAFVAEPLEFRGPQAEEIQLSNGVTAFFIEDRSLPLVNLYALFRGGSTHFPREDLAAVTALGSSLILTAGTEALPPDSVDELIEYHAFGFSFSAGGGATMMGVETLTRHLDLAFDLWAEALRAPRLDPDRIEVWRLRQLESVRRSDDSPASIAISKFNNLLFGDHPIGWQLDEDDLQPDRLSEDRLRRLHGMIFCSDNMILGVVGDLSKREAYERLEHLFGDWPACPEPLPEPPLPDLRRQGGVHLIHKGVNQSSIVVGQPGGITQRDHPDFYASQVANFILGGGGLASRLTTRIRSEEGLAYSAATVWGAGTRHERIFGAFAQTRGEATIAAAEMIRETLDEARTELPGRDEVQLAIDYSVNGFVFAFENPAQVVTRQMSYRLAGLPDDWLERYLDGIQRVTPAEVRDVVRRYIDPALWTYVIVGDTTLFQEPITKLGPALEFDKDRSSR